MRHGGVAPAEVTMDWTQGKSLDDLLRRTQEQVKKEPAAAKHRIFLFQLLSILGQWDRASTQLDLVGEMDAAALPMVHTYRAALNIEALRRKVFAGERLPLVFGKPEQWVALCLQALGLNAQGKHGQAKALRGEAFEMAPMSSGRIGAPQDQAFQWIADADERLGPMLEAIIDGKYYWVPFLRIAGMTIEEPHDVRDLVWMPAYFRWTNGGESVGLIPTRYSGSEVSVNDRIRIAALTEWIDVGEDTYQGIGQRLLATDAGEYSLMDLRQLTFEQPPAAQP